MFDDLLDANRLFAEQFSLQGVPSRPTKSLCLVTCMDNRVEPALVFGCQPGDMNVLRNAGGRVTPDVLRSLVLATTFLGVSRVAVMHHSDCAMTKLDASAIRAALSPEQAAGCTGWDFLTMSDPDDALATDVRQIVGCAAIRREVAVEGWRYDVGSGAVARIVELQMTGS